MDEALKELEIAESQRRDHEAMEFATFATYTGIKKLEQGELDAAVAQFKSAVEGAPKYAPAYYQLSLALEKLGRKQEASEARARAEALDPGLRLSRSDLGLRGWVQSRVRGRR